MHQPPGSLEIVRSQRDNLAVAYHDLQVELALLKISLTQTNELLETAKTRIVELEKSDSAMVEMASNAATDAAA